MACLGLAVVSWVSVEACENTVKPVDELQGQTPTLQAIHVPPDVFRKTMLQQLALTREGPNLRTAIAVR